jgi:hypothetical protein
MIVQNRSGVTSTAAKFYGKLSDPSAAGAAAQLSQQAGDGFDISCSVRLSQEDGSGDCVRAFLPHQMNRAGSVSDNSRMTVCPCFAAVTLQSRRAVSDANSTRLQEANEDSSCGLASRGRDVNLQPRLLKYTT